MVLSRWIYYSNICNGPAFCSASGLAPSKTSRAMEIDHYDHHPSGLLGDLPSHRRLREAV